MTSTATYGNSIYGEGLYGGTIPLIYEVVT